MRTISSLKARPTGPKDLTLRIYFDRLPRSFADEEWTEDAARSEYQREARELVAALVSHLPGGFLDAVFAVLAERKASVLVAPHRWGHRPLPVGEGAAGAGAKGSVTSNVADVPAAEDVPQSEPVPAEDESQGEPGAGAEASQERVGIDPQSSAIVELRRRVKAKILEPAALTDALRVADLIGGSTLWSKLPEDVPWIEVKTVVAELRKARGR